MNNDAVVREQLSFLLGGGNAHMPFSSAVAGFPPEHFNSRPPNIPYTFWHLLEHIRIAQWDILEFIRIPNHVSPEWPRGYWPEEDQMADEFEWENTIRDIESDSLALQELVMDPLTDLYAPLPHGAQYNIVREILVESDHKAYHIGEFSILRKVMGIE